MTEQLSHQESFQDDLLLQAVAPYGLEDLQDSGDASPFSVEAARKVIEGIKLERTASEAAATNQVREHRLQQQTNER